MVLYLLRRDDSLKIALVCALLAPCVLVAGGPGPLLFLQQILFVGIFAAVRLRLLQRSTRFQLALPIASRDLLLVRIAGVLLAVWFPITVAAMFLAANHRQGLLNLLQGGAVITLAALLPLTWRLSEAAISLLAQVGLPAGVLAIGAAMWFVLPPLAHLTIFTVLSIALAARTLIAAPSAFEVSGERVSWAPPSFWSLPAAACWPIVRTALPWVGILIFLFVYCFTVSVVKVYSYVLLTFGLGMLCRARFAWLQGLPLSRRAILWMTLAVTAAPFLAAVAAATWIHRPSFIPLVRPRVGQFMVGLDPRDRHLYETNVPLEFWRRAPNGKPPLIRAPWGETGVPYSRSILGFVLYNPYSATKTNSDSFFEWQFENATQALNGRRIPFEQYRLIPYRDIPDYPQQNRVDVIAFAVLAFWVLTGAYLQESRIPQAVVMTIGGAFMFVDSAGAVIFFGTSNLSSLLQALFMPVAALPLPTWALAAIGAVPCLAIYLLLEWQSARSEIVNTPAIITSP